MTTSKSESKVPNTTAKPVVPPVEPPVTYIVLKGINLSTGDRYEPGDTIELNTKDAASLLASDAIEKES